MGNLCAVKHLISLKAELAIVFEGDLPAGATHPPRGFVIQQNVRYPLRQPAHVAPRDQMAVKTVPYCLSHCARIHSNQR